MTTLTTNMNRRKFIAFSGAVGAGAVIAANSMGAGALTTPSSSTTVTVWKLNPNWGFPLGPKGKTRVSSNASLLHATNKIFVSEAAAIAGKISPCSLAQPYSIELCAEDAAELWSHSMDGGISADMRCPGVPEIMARAGRSCAVPVPPAPTTPATPAGTPTGSDDALSGAGVRGAVPTVSTSRTPAGSLPVTGASSMKLGTFGIGAIAVGAVAAAIARRNNSEELLKDEGLLAEEG